ncbi:hypothetical protein CGRA01v4_10707 [Colletotrichum graminicola]|nr:hypothetical protein CGRA01v4_10707 [Colletotrichum graminicola]
MIPVIIALWAVAAVIPAQSLLLCECGQNDETGWSYSSGMTRNTCREVGGKMQNSKWPACKFSGSESTWNSKCAAQDNVGHSAKGYCDDKDGYFSD